MTVIDRAGHMQFGIRHAKRSRTSPEAYAQAQVNAAARALVMAGKCIPGNVAEVPRDMLERLSVAIRALDAATK